MCRAPLNFSTSNRNLLCEKVIRLLPLECSFLEYGCQASNIRDNEELLLHEKHCHNRLIRCIFPACQNFVPMNKLLSHLSSTKHAITKVTSSNSISDFDIQTSITRFISNYVDGSTNSRSCWSVAQIVILPGHFSLKNKYFFTELVPALPPEENWIFWLYMLGSEQEALEYEFTLSFESTKNSSSSICENSLNKYTGACVSVDCDIETVVKNSLSGVNEKFVRISNQTISSFIFEERLPLHIEIKKKSHKLPLAVSFVKHYETDREKYSQSHNNFQAESHATRMRSNVSESYKQVEKISSSSGQASAFEKGPYSKSKQQIKFRLKGFKQSKTTIL